MSQKPFFAFSDILALEFFPKLDEDDKGPLESNPVYQYSYFGLNDQQRLECIKEMVEEALEEFNGKEDAWFVVVKCIDRVTGWGGSMNYPVEIGVLRAAYKQYR